MTLRDYQQRLLDDLRLSMRSHRHVLGVLPTGGGKTVVFGEVAAAARQRGADVVVLVHRRELLIQTQAKVDAPVQTIQSWVPNGEDLVIVDEAHHVCAQSWGDKLAFSRRILGFTATPQRLDGNGLGRVFDAMVEGPTSRELIAAGWLSKYKLYAPPGGYDIRGVANAVKNWKLLAPGRQTIGFCASVAHMHQTAAAFEQADVRVGCIDGRMKREDRDKMVQAFRDGDIRVLLSVELISEGFDVPDCDCVLLLRRTKSLSMFLQQVGRGLRPGKQECVILDCAGNSNIHGLPDEPRAWSLEGHAKPREGLVADMPVRVCPQCYSVHKQTLRVCPACGFNHPLDSRIPEERDLILQERKTARRAVGRARNVEELEAIARERGYSMRWVDHVLKSRGARRY